MVTNNMISGSGRFGSGSAAQAAWNGDRDQQQDRGPEVGIGVSNSENGYAFIAMNMISGAPSWAASVRLAETT